MGAGSGALASSKAGLIRGGGGRTRSGAGVVAAQRGDVDEEEDEKQADKVGDEE